ncbi:MAG TPA: hypothetical protein PK156_49350, partial [Polyangium sp.]|nr:hypothetical protein [Polyangium sp.]
MRKINQSLVLGISSVLAFVAATSHVSAQTCTLATPTAEGAGRCTTGGRGGDVKIVTSLAASGAGTLADAITTAPSAGRIIVFAKSGVIDLTTTDASGNPTGGAIYVNNSNITIAGQTAPGEGITITGGKLMVRGSNVILEHIRSRRGFIRADVDHGDAISIEPATGVTQSNIFVEHVSASWGTDENLSLADAGAATLQWNLIAEGLNYSNAASNPTNHGYGSIWAGHGGTEASFFHTLYAHNNRRNPHIGNYTGSGSPTMDFRNNVVYDWQDFASHNNGGATYNINFVNNYYKSGPSSLTANTVFTFDAPSTNTKMYSSGNVLNGSAASEATNNAFPAGTTWSTFQNSTAFASSAYTTIAAAQN